MWLNYVILYFLFIVIGHVVIYCVCPIILRHTHLHTHEHFPSLVLLFHSDKHFIIVYCLTHTFIGISSLYLLVYFVLLLFFSFPFSFYSICATYYYFIFLVILFLIKSGFLFSFLSLLSLLLHFYFIYLYSLSFSLFLDSLCIESYSLVYILCPNSHISLGYMKAKLILFLLIYFLSYNMVSKWLFY